MRSFVLTVDGTDYQVKVGEGAVIVDGHQFRVEVTGRRVTVDSHEHSVELDGATAWVDGFAHPFLLNDGRAGATQRTPATAQTAELAPSPAHVERGPTASPSRGSTGSIYAAMPGRILRVLVHEGGAVQAGDPVCILEAMKMENELRAPDSGTVQKIMVKPGQSVEAGEALIVLA